MLDEEIKLVNVYSCSCRDNLLIYSYLLSLYVSFVWVDEGIETGAEDFQIGAITLFDF